RGDSTPDFWSHLLDAPSADPDGAAIFRDRCAKGGISRLVAFLGGGLPGTDDTRKVSSPNAVKRKFPMQRLRLGDSRDTPSTSPRSRETRRMAARFRGPYLCLFDRIGYVRPERCLTMRMVVGRSSRSSGPVGPPA